MQHCLALSDAMQVHKNATLNQLVSTVDICRDTIIECDHLSDHLMSYFCIFNALVHDKIY